MKWTELRFDPTTGLAPAIVQDAENGAVLMLGYVNAESLALTASTGYVHFWSRSRNEMWRKGDTSGNAFHVVSTSIDCDADTVLFLVHPAGPACHEGTTTCFNDPGSDAAARPSFANSSSGVLDDLWEVIASRVRERPEGSYTTELIERGVDGVSRKVVEEATEVLLAAKNHAAGESSDRLDEEVADLLYHVFVLLAERGVTPRGSLDVLRRRRLAGT